ncbi:MAG: tRNA pseudouridine(55) synthase TruB [Paracoccaceae bacterium]|nr:tRNA pseudouridine(55) synthase TruB [Paracoccaceae bacterium]
MSRRSKGKALNGWLVVDKNVGYTSATIVNKVRWLLNAQKAGHAGTLDPDATGILAIALGEATKTIPYLMNAHKTYQFKIHLGSATNTDDVTGHIIRVSDDRPTDIQLTEILKYFRGNIQQIPPKYSAVKINGNRAYKLSRYGITDLNLKARNLFIEKLEIIERVDADSVIMEMICGKGGYVRSIARDIGEKLGCFAHAGQIRRIASGPFTLSNVISDDIIFKENIPKILAHIQPVEMPLDQLQRFDCLICDANEIKHGKKILINGDPSKETFEAFVCFNNEPIAIGKVTNNYFFPKRVFSFFANE